MRWYRSADHQDIDTRNFECHAALQRMSASFAGALVPLLLTICTKAARSPMTADKAIGSYRELLRNATFTSDEPILLMGPVATTHARFLHDPVVPDENGIVLVCEADESSEIALTPGSGSSFNLKIAQAPVEVVASRDPGGSDACARIVEIVGLRPGRLHAVFVVPASAWRSAGWQQGHKTGLKELVSGSEPVLELALPSGRIDDMQSWKGVLNAAITFHPPRGSSKAAQAAGATLAALLKHRMIGRSRLSASSDALPQ